MGIRLLKGKRLDNRRLDWKIKRKESCGNVEDCRTGNLVKTILILLFSDNVIR